MPASARRQQMRVAPPDSLTRKFAPRFEAHNPPVARLRFCRTATGKPTPGFRTAIGKATGDITRGSRDFETREILVQNRPNRTWPTGNRCRQAGSLLADACFDVRRKVLQHNALCRRVSGGFFGDNLRVVWILYGLDSVREPHRFRTF